ncbi:MAG: hypothetical protein ACE5FY_04115 [Nitrospiria bacterium]
MTLKKITHLVVEIVPDLGTHFIFPFVLDEGDSAIPFTMVSTNKVFSTARKEKRNSFVVLVDREKIPPQFQGGEIPQYFGNLFLTAGDYMVSIELRTTNDLTQHYTDIVFKFGPLEQEILIQKVIDQRVRRLESEYRQRMEEIDLLAEKKVVEKLGELAIRTPVTRKIKEEAVERLGEGEVVLYVDRSLSYGPFLSIVYEIENKGRTGLTITDIRLMQENTVLGSNIEIKSEKDFPPRLMSDQTHKGVISITKNIITPDGLLTLQVTTNKGNIETTW